MKRGYKDYVFDLSDVLATWPKDLTCPIDRKALRACLVSRNWFEHESGHTSRAECFAALGAQFNTDPAVLEAAWAYVTAQLKPDAEMLALVRELRAHPGVRVFGAFNVPREDYAAFRAAGGDAWDALDGVFASHELGIRMPHPGFFRRVFEDANAGLAARDTVYVGHDADDVVTAKSFGAHGILLADFKAARRELRNLVGDPVKRGWEYLRANAGKLACDADRPGVSIMENFGQLLILEATGDRRVSSELLCVHVSDDRRRSLVTLKEPERYWNYFQGKGILTHENFPDDLDTTSLGLVTMKPPKEHVHSIMDEMLTLLSDDGLPYTYFDRECPRLDPVVAINVLHLFYTHGRGHELPGALASVHRMLLHRAYFDGTRYYFRECFLFFVARLLEAAPGDAHLQGTLRELLVDRVRELVGAPGDAIALAFRVVTCASLGVRNEMDMRALLPLQEEDGGWEIGWIYRYGISGMKIGSRGTRRRWRSRRLRTWTN
ncbi:HAD-like domain-containing protein [Epithele typhae]|uniref:HAD-like domain-containing protein n=1 Tax=Epithele typhae TaxID=378194 RepID=UPI0020083B93|nr:HAD-like domain-containing protein [Epithele typhae]KAH9929520.1 HAD-like domain-containing protein [Epithele typhae]